MSRPSTALSSARRAPAFTLIEVMIVVVVVGLLAAVALPSFMDSIRKGRRAEATGALAQVQQEQERWRANRTTYTSTLSDLKLGIDADGKTPSGYYAISIEQANGSGYIAKAAAVSGTSQAADTNCTTMRLRLRGGNVEYGGCNACGLPEGNAPLSDPNRCWSR